MKDQDKLNISDELQAFMNFHKIESITELLSNSDAALLKMGGFGWRLMKEVLRLRQIE